MESALCASSPAAGDTRQHSFLSAFSPVSKETDSSGSFQKDQVKAHTHTGRRHSDVEPCAYHRSCRQKRKHRAWKLIAASWSSIQLQQSANLCKRLPRHLSSQTRASCSDEESSSGKHTCKWKEARIQECRRKSTLWMKSTPLTLCYKQLETCFKLNLTSTKTFEVVFRYVASGKHYVFLMQISNV